MKTRIIKKSKRGRDQAAQDARFLPQANFGRENLRSSSWSKSFVSKSEVDRFDAVGELVKSQEEAAIILKEQINGNKSSVVLGKPQKTRRTPNPAATRLIRAQSYTPSPAIGSNLFRELADQNF